MTWGVTKEEKPEDRKNNNVPVDIPTVVQTPAPNGPIGYASRTAYFAGVAKVIGGILCFVFGLLQCYSLWRLHLLGRVCCGYGEACGLIFIATGAVAISASKHKSPKRIAASLGMAFISVMVSAATWVYMVYFAATKARYWRYMNSRRYRHGDSSSEESGRRGSHGSHHSGHRNGSHHGDGDGSHHRERRGIFEGGHHNEMLIPVVFLVSTIIIFIMLTTMFCVSILQAVVCYRAYKTANRYRTMEEDTTYIVPFKTKEKMMADEDDLPKKV